MLTAMLLDYYIIQIEMEKVPNLSMFSQRHMKKSNSLSRINHCSSNDRPSSSFHPQHMNTAAQKQDYYRQALNLLNTDSKIANELKNIQIKHDSDAWRKTNLKKVTKNQHFERPSFNQTKNCENIPQFHQISQPMTIATHIPQPHFHSQQPQQMQIIINQPPKIFFNQASTMKRGDNFINPNPTYHNPPVQLREHQQIPFHIISQNQQTIPRNTVQHPPPINPQMAHSLKRSNSVQNIHNANSQILQMNANCQIVPVCNNQQEKPSSADKKQYTFRNKETESPFKTRNPFLFDATYLLDIKQSESRLPDLVSIISNREFSEELDKKQELLQQLYEIRQQNVVESNQFLHQLDCLINQFQSKQPEVKAMQQSVMKNSRRSLFNKIQ